MMKELELCKRFFFEVGLPTIKEKMPECVPYLAAGCGGGSQCHEDDDEVSRDHGWGPGFAVWMIREDYERFAKPLQAVLDWLPKEFLGYGGEGCVVFEIGEYVKSIVGCEIAPAMELDWLHIPEESLFEITHRPVFYDPIGEVTTRFKSFAQYPEDVWKKRLSACLAWLWEWGVKHLQRAERRGDIFTAAMYWCRFATYAMKVGFLLNRHYAPYHKWLYRQFLKLPQIAPRVAPLLRKGFELEGGREKVVTQIVKIYTQYLTNIGYRPVSFKPKQGQFLTYQDAELLNYAQAVHNSIHTHEIRNLPIWLEVKPPPWKPTWTYIFP